MHVFERLEVQAEVYPCFTLMECVVRQISGNVVNAAEPAHLVHEAQLIVGEKLFVEPLGYLVVDTNNFTVEDKDAGPLRSKVTCDCRAICEHRSHAVDDVHDGTF